MFILCDECFVYLYYVLHVYVWWSWREEGDGSPGIGIRMVVSQNVGAGNQTQVLWESSKCS